MSTPLEMSRLGLQLPITNQARSLANQFSETQLTPEKADQVRLNTLAVWVMNDYCQMMDIPTELEQSDSWNPVLRMMANVADLTLPGLGQLECRPVRAEAQTCTIPPEVWDQRLGYVVVEMDDRLQTACLLGFTPAVTEVEFSLSQLQPLEALLDYLYALRQPSAIAAVVNLSQWLNNTFDAEWQRVESVLNPDRLSLAMGFRNASVASSREPEPSPSGLSRAKQIDLTVQLRLQQVILVVNVQPAAPDRAHIGLQVHPAGQPFLSPDLELAVLEPSDVVFMQAQSRQADNYIQLQFSGSPGERFKVRIRLEDTDYLEEFVI